MSKDDIVYHLFGHEASHTAKRVRGHMYKFFSDHYTEFQPVASEYIKIKGIDFDDYVTYLTLPDKRADLFIIWMLARLYQCHVAVITKDRIWYTFKGDEGSLEDCKFILCYLGGNEFCDTRRLRERPKGVKERVAQVKRVRRTRKEIEDDPTYSPLSEGTKNRGKSPKKSAITFEASTFSRIPVTKSVKGKMPKRKAASQAIKRLRRSYESDPDHEKNISRSSSDEESIEVSDQESEKITETKEKVIGTITFPKRSDPKAASPKTSLTFESGTYTSVRVPNTGTRKRIARKCKVAVKSRIHRYEEESVHDKNLTHSSSEAEVVEQNRKVAVKGRRQHYEDDPDFDVNLTSSSSGSEVDDVAEVKHVDTESYDRGARSKHTVANTESGGDTDATEIYSVEDYVGKGNVVPVKIRKIIGIKPKSEKQIPARYFTISRRRKKKMAKCTLCGKQFNNQTELNQHKIKDHNIKYICNKCSKSFTNAKSLNNHVRRHSPQNLPYPCKRCNKRFLRPSELVDHRAVHRKKDKFKKYVCEFRNCNFKSNRKYLLTRHIKQKHTERMRFKCPKCVQVFDGKKQMKQHLQTHNPPSIPCGVCKKLFRHYNSRNLHQKKCILVE